MGRGKGRGMEGNHQPQTAPDGGHKNTNSPKSLHIHHLAEGGHYRLGVARHVQAAVRGRQVLYVGCVCACVCVCGLVGWWWLVVVGGWAGGFVCGGLVGWWASHIHPHIHVHPLDSTSYTQRCLLACSTSTRRNLTCGFQRGASPKCRIQLRRAPTTSTTSACNFCEFCVGVCVF